jgi:hypothetical protein
VLGRDRAALAAQLCHASKCKSVVLLGGVSRGEASLPPYKDCRSDSCYRLSLVTGGSASRCCTVTFVVVMVQLAVKCVFPAATGVGVYSASISS